MTEITELNSVFPICEPRKQPAQAHDVRHAAQDGGQEHEGQY